jgi:hypothetical protein
MSLRRRFEALERAYDEMRAFRDRESARVVALRAQNSDLRSAAVKLEDENESLRESLGEWKLDFRSLQAENERLQTELNLLDAARTEKLIDELRAENKRLRERSTVQAFDRVWADNKQLREALPDPDKLLLLADWFDRDDANKERVGLNAEVQADLRRWARNARIALGQTAKCPTCGSDDRRVRRAGCGYFSQADADVRADRWHYADGKEGERDGLLDHPDQYDSSKATVTWDLSKEDE